MKHADQMAHKYQTMSSTASALSLHLADPTGMGPTRLAKNIFLSKSRSYDFVSIVSD